MPHAVLPCVRTHYFAADRLRLYPPVATTGTSGRARVFQMGHGQAAGGVYTARVAGYQDELAEFRAAPEARADAQRDSLWPASGMPSMMNRAELARLPGVTPGRPSCLVRYGRKHPASGHG